MVCRRVGVEGVFVPVEFVVTAAALLFCCLAHWPWCLLILVVYLYFASGYHCFAIAIHVDLPRRFLHLCSVLHCLVDWHVALFGLPNV